MRGHHHIGAGLIQHRSPLRCGRLRAKTEEFKARYQSGETLADETFEGEIWALAIPKSVKELAVEIAAYTEKNPVTDKVSESFGGYSYSRASGTTGAPTGWQGAFASRLAPYRRISDD